MKPLERILGPGTADLRLRIGLHSGSVTAGFLRNEKRFQIFGDTVNIAQSIESSSRRNRILISSDTAELLKAAKKGQWIQKCEDIDPISTKNKGTLDAYWLLQAGDKGQLVSTPNVPVRARSVEDLVALGNSDAPPSFPRRGAVETYRDNFILALPPMSRSEKTQRLIDWVVELLANQLRNIKAQRDVLGVYASPLSDVDFNRTIPIDSIVEAIKIPKFDPVCQSVILRDNDNVNVDPLVLSQLRALVTRIAHKHRSELPFHNFVSIFDVLVLSCLKPLPYR